MMSHAAKERSENALKALSQPNLQQQRLLDNRIGMHEHVTSSLDRYAKGVLCNTVMVGVTKMVSYRTTLAFYNINSKNFIKYHSKFVRPRI